MVVGVLSVLCLSLMCIAQARDIDIYKSHIVSDIAYRFATTNVTSYLVNRANTSREAEFKLTIPDEAFINKFFMVIDGEIYHGTVKEKAEAQQQYDAAKKLGQSAGQIKRRKNTKANIFEVQVNIAAASKVEFSLTSQELLQRKLGIYEHVINLDPGQVVKDLKVEVNIRESRKIVLLEVPELKKEHQNSITNQENPHAVVERISDNEAKITYAPDSRVQKDASKNGIAGQFVVEYDVERTQSGGELLVVDGYFVHFFAPNGLDPVPQDIMFILDVSGSMSGRKLDQLKIAMDKIVGNLRPEDRFNIITFATNSELWQQEGLIQANPSNLAQAKEFIGNLNTRGSTNINDALLQGIRFLKTHKTLSETTKRPAVMIFLTDGMPNESESNTTKIIRNLVAANEGYASVFSLGFGNDVDFKFLKSLSLQNDAFARKIYLDADPALQLQNFYDEVSTPLLTDVKINYLGNTVDKETVTPTCFLNFFEGSEIVVAGKLRDMTADNIVSQVLAGSATGALELDVEANVTETQNLTTVFDVNHFTERLWAYLTIKKMLDKKLQTTDANVTAEANQKALDLALQYQFVTPLTSMVVTKPNETEELYEPLEEPDVAYDSFLMSSVMTGGVGFGGPAGPSARRAYYSPPSRSYSMARAFPNLGSGVSYMINTNPGKRRRPKPAMPRARPTYGTKPPTSHAAAVQTTTTTTTSTTVPAPLTTCLKVSGGNGDLFQLIYDQETDIVMNGKARIPKTLPSGHTSGEHAYFARIAIMHLGVTLLIKPRKITLDGDTFDWNMADGRISQNVGLRLNDEDELIVQISFVSTLKFINHRHFLEVVRVAGALDLRCSVLTNFQSGTSSLVWNRQMILAHLTSHDQNSECLQAFTENDRLPNTSCNTIQNGQWENVVGRQVRYHVPQIYHKGSAVEFR